MATEHIDDDVDGGMSEGRGSSAKKGVTRRRRSSMRARLWTWTMCYERTASWDERRRRQVAPQEQEGWHERSSVSRSREVIWMKRLK